MPAIADGPQRLTPEDLDAVCALLVASDLAVLGMTDFTPDDVVADLRRDGLEAYGWYADGRLAAYGWVRPSDDSNQVEIDLYVHPAHDAGLGHDVLAHLSARADELTRAGYDAPWMDTGVYRQDERTRSWMRAGGFTVGTTFTRMRIDLADLTDAGEAVDRIDLADLTDAGEVEPSAPRIAIRQVALDAYDPAADLRIAHRISQESFSEHYGHIDQSYDVWRARLTERGNDHAQVFVADLDGVPTGVLVATRQFEPDQDAGYVRTLGVLSDGRGAGVAKALLRHEFRRSRDNGRVAVLLHVDVANVTGALRLYESVGMRTVLEIDAWSRGTRAEPTS